MAIKEIALLKKMDFQRQITFAYLSCERVYPNYKYFSDNHNFGSSDILRGAIDFLYDGIFNKIDDDLKIDKYLKEVDAIAPRPDNFSTFYATVAMNSAGVVYESINLLKQSDSSRILDDISTMCTDAIDIFILEQELVDDDDVDFEEKVISHALMQQELSIQKGIISFLNRINEVSSSDIDTLLGLQKEGTGTLVL